MFASQRKDTFYKTNTLNCIPTLLFGQAVLIYLRDETSVAGRIDESDGFLNISLTDAVFIDRLAKQYFFDNFTVPARNIRYIHIPAHIDIQKEVGDYMQSLQQKREHSREKRTFKGIRAAKRHNEVLLEIQKQHEEREKLKETEAVEE